MALTAVLLLALAGCGGGDSSTADTLNGTPQATRVVHDVEAIAHACAKGGTSKRANAALVDLSKIAVASPEATFGPAGAELPMHEVLRRTAHHFKPCL